jgi:hypothetical protein
MLVDVEESGKCGADPVGVKGPPVSHRSPIKRQRM